MKRIAIIAVMLLLGLGASARSTHYFTLSQASRTVKYLNAQNELMIYCGYDYEIETYVLINEIWMERINSSYYEIWLYGYDAYTGDEIYMPIDLECIWLISAGRVFNAAQYLRFRVDVRTPSFAWRIPPYNPYTRAYHRHGHVRTYHYDIHRHGWRPPTYTYGPGMPPPPLPHYYMRHPHSEAPMPTTTWTPGVEKPNVAIVEKTRDKNPTTGTVVNSSHTSGTTGKSNSTATSSGRPSTNATNTRGNNNTATTQPSKQSSSTSTSTPSTTPSRSSATSSRTNTRANSNSNSATTTTTTTTTTTKTPSTRTTTITPTTPSTSSSAASSSRTNTRNTGTTVTKPTTTDNTKTTATRGTASKPAGKTVTSSRTNTRKK